MSTSDTTDSARQWTTLWDRQNHRVLLLAGRGPTELHWKFVEHDPRSSAEGIYDVWREQDGDIVFVEIRLDYNDTPLGFPTHLLDDQLLGSPTIWPTNLPSFIWWHKPS